MVAEVSDSDSGGQMHNGNASNGIGLDDMEWRWTFRGSCPGQSRPDKSALIYWPVP